MTSKPVQATIYRAWRAAAISILSICSCIVFVPLIISDIADLKAELAQHAKEFAATDKEVWDSMQDVAKLKRSYDTDSQQQLCNCQADNTCPAGSPGVGGDPGRPGESGLPGLDGSPGEPGQDVKGQLGTMSKCVECPPGSVGPPGLTGRKGHAGMTGVPGITGTNGSPGIPGGRGPVGVIGRQGNLGMIGKSGTPGSEGTGGKGYPGTKGEPGRAGLMGSRGRPGAKKGRPGFPGPMGTVGPTGEPGTAGPDGVPGTVGVVGIHGSDMLYCTCPEKNQGSDMSTQYRQPPAIKQFDTQRIVPMKNVRNDNEFDMDFTTGGQLYMNMRDNDNYFDLMEMDNQDDDYAWSR